MQQISHSEVRRHPIWQQELHHERRVAKPNGAISPQGRLVLVTVFAALVLALVLVAGG